LEPPQAAIQGSATPESLEGALASAAAADAGSSLDKGAFSGDASAVAAGALVEMRRGLKLSPRQAASQRLALSHTRLARLVDGALWVESARGRGKRLEIAMREPRRLIALPDGSLLAASHDGTFRLAPRATQAEAFPRVTLFADSFLLPDRLNNDRFWVFHPTLGALYGHSLEAGRTRMLPIAQFVTLPTEPATTAPALVGLPDGAFAYATVRGLRRFFAGGKSWMLALPKALSAPLRLEADRRVDRLWWLEASGEFRLLAFAGTTVREASRRDVVGEVFELASDGGVIAALVVQTDARASRRWQLVVMKHPKHESLVVPLEADPEPIGDDWVELVTRNRHVALSATDSLVAAGGPDGVRVWEIDTGKLVAEH
jgi:hypothetical protein